MQSKLSLKAITLFIFLIPFMSMAGGDAASGDLKTEIKEYITHHLEDAYDFSLFSYTNKSGKHIYIGIPLPVILWDNGLKTFSSSKFHHGETVAEVDGNYYAINHNKIYKTDAAGTITYDEEHHATNIAPLDFSITKGVVSIMFTFLLIVFLVQRSWTFLRSKQRNCNRGWAFL